MTSSTRLSYPRLKPWIIHIEVGDDDQYARLERIEDDHGLTRRGMLIHAANDLETPGGQQPVACSAGPTARIQD